MKKPERLGELAEHQQAKVREMEHRSEQELALAIQQCYRHVFYPSRNRVGKSDTDLAHTAIDTHSASDRPGAGQRQIVRILRDLNKLRLSEDEPDSPAYVRDRTPLKKGHISTLSPRGEFRRNPALPILVGDDTFVRGVRRGIEQGEYLYQRGELVCGLGGPAAMIEIDEQSTIYTAAFANEVGVWPRQPVEPTDPPKDETAQDDTGAASGEGSGTEPDESAAGRFSAEGVLREALVKLWEQARANKIQAIGLLSIRMFEAGDGFRLLGAVGAVSDAEKAVTIVGDYESRDGGSFEMEFRGPVTDAQPIREFLEPQLRDAKSRRLEVRFDLAFGKGLSMDGEAAEKLTERLNRFATGAAYVSATAEVKP